MNSGVQASLQEPLNRIKANRQLLADVREMVQIAKNSEGREILQPGVKVPEVAPMETDPGR